MKISGILWLMCCLWLPTKSFALIPKIAIVGGGIGGTSTAYFLKDLFGKNGAEIDIYESKKIGGRLATVDVDGKSYEVGGSVIHPSNQYAVNFMKSFGLKKKAPQDSSFGLYNGDEFLILENSQWSIINMLKFLWRYGISVVRLQDYISDILNKFVRIYSLQDSARMYTNVSDMLEGISAEFSEALNVSARQGFIDAGFPKILIDELITATLVVNYGQTLDVHKFVGAVSVAGASPDLFSIEGGNRLIPESLLNASDATLRKDRVTDIELLSTGKYRVHNTNNQSLEYDAVILAVPFATNISPSIKFKNFPSTFNFDPPGRYHRTISTVVQGDLNYTYFGFENEKDAVNEILCVRNDLTFNSIGKIYPVNSEEYQSSDVWKVFSQVPLSEAELSKLFSNRKDVIVTDWLAYPHYGEKKRLDNFKLHNYLYHVNAIEWAASAMEMSMIGGKNVALLFYNDWNDVERTTVKPHLKEEL